MFFLESTAIGFGILRQVFFLDPTLILGVKILFNIENIRKKKKVVLPKNFAHTKNATASILNQVHQPFKKIYGLKLFNTNLK